jgi:ADP-heptose:LPS heptosyltransferase
MTVLDEIVTVDTAAVHLGGALGHPKINLLLDTHWASWRWLAPWYKLTTWRLDLERPLNPAI